MKILKTFLFGLFCFAGGWLLNGACGVEIRAEDGLPAIEEIQKRIGCEKIDGILGRETQEKWDRAIAEQLAARAWREANKGDDK